MIGHLIWYDRDRDIGNDLQNEWRLWIMNLEFWILDGIQNLRTPAADVLMPFITSFGNGGVIWIVLTVILLLIPKTRKTGLILAAALILAIHSFLYSLFLFFLPTYAERRALIVAGLAALKVLLLAP